MPDPAPIATTPSVDPSTPPAPSALDAVLDGDQVPEKFRGKKVADVISSYKSLESKLGAPKPAPAAAPAIAPIEPPAPDDEAGMSTMLDRAGLKAEALAETWKSGGKLSDEQYAALKKVGVTRGMANEYLGMVHETADARQWRVDRAISEAESVAGGKQQLETLRQWAGSGGVATDRLARLNAQLKNDPGFYPDYIRLIATEHQTAVGAGKAQPIIGGNRAPVSTGIPKDSREMAALTAAAARGDADAISRIKSMSEEDFAAFVTKQMNS